jgi:Fe-S-cluster containining protein
MGPCEIDPVLAKGWLAAAGDPSVAAGLEAVYQIIADQVEARRPVCVNSGRCCNFRAFDHRLYTTGLEAAYTVLNLPAGVGLTAAGVEAAVARGDCPFLTGRLCGVHAVRPSGCRVFYCDQTAVAWQGDLSERVVRLVRGLHDRHGVEYRYAEWRVLLAALCAAGASGPRA